MASESSSLVAKFARTQLLYPFATPIHPLKRLSEHLGGKVNLYAKREDTNSGKFVIGANLFIPFSF
jgi:1-aminocyclopropane-1-carboxylate deaminase/D-cysteine desulfhydrase-like pyridoxal-dependent ACC family enzyme